MELLHKWFIALRVRLHLRQKPLQPALSNQHHLQRRLPQPRLRAARIFVPRRHTVRVTLALVTELAILPTCTAVTLELLSDKLANAPTLPPYLTPPSPPHHLQRLVRPHQIPLLHHLQPWLQWFSLLHPLPPVPLMVNVQNVPQLSLVAQELATTHPSTVVPAALTGLNR